MNSTRKFSYFATNNCLQSRSILINLFYWIRVHIAEEWCEVEAIASKIIQSRLWNKKLINYR